MATKDLIDARPETISSLVTFSSNPSPIIIPTYQRPYQWDTSRAIDILKLSDPDSKDFGFIGTMVFVRNNDDHLEVVDGQQRLITIILTLCAFRDFLDERSTSIKDDTVAEQLREMARDIQKDHLVVSRSYSSVEAKPRLEFKRNTYDTFKNHYLLNNKKFKPDDDIYKQELATLDKNYAAAKKYFNEKYEGANERNIVPLLNRRFTKLLELVVNAIYISQPNLAGEVFESINGTGVNLKLSELVKNYIFRNIDSESIEQDWELISHNCDLKNPYIENLIKYDWQSRYDITDDFEIFRSIRTHTDDTKAYFAKIVRLSKIMSFYLHPEENNFKHLKLVDNSNDKNHIIRYASILRTLQVKQFLRVIFALDGLREYIDIRQYTKLLELLTNFQVRAKVANVGTNGIDSLYSKYAQAFMRIASDVASGSIPKNKIRDRVTSLLFDEMHGSMKKLSPDYDFVDAFSRLERPKSNKDIFKYLLAEIEYRLQKNELVVDVRNNHITLEEIYPQTPSEEWSSAECKVTDTYKIGNATILTGRDNRVASNNTISDKVLIYKTSNLKLNKQLVDLIGASPSWSSAKIESRGRVLAEYAKEIWKL